MNSVTRARWSVNRLNFIQPGSSDDPWTVRYSAIIYKKDARRSILSRTLTIFTSGPSKLLTQVRWESSVPSENLAIPEKKPRKTYKVMRKVNPTEDILSPEQWKHMRVSFHNPQNVTMTLILFFSIKP